MTNVVCQARRDKTDMPSSRSKNYELTYRGENFKSQMLLFKALVQAALKARKSFRRAQWNPTGWKRVDPESYQKAVDLNMMRKVFQETV